MHILCFIGRQQDVRATEIDKVDMYQSYRPGDIVRAVVVSLREGEGGDLMQIIFFSFLLPTLFTLTFPWVIHIYVLQLTAFFYIYTFTLKSILFVLINIFGWLEKLRSLNDVKAFSW